MCTGAHLLLYCIVYRLLDRLQIVPAIRMWQHTGHHMECIFTATIVVGVVECSQSVYIKPCFYMYLHITGIFH